MYCWPDKQVFAILKEANKMLFITDTQKYIYYNNIASDLYV